MVEFKIPNFGILQCDIPNFLNNELIPGKGPDPLSGLYIPGPGSQVKGPSSQVPRMGPGAHFSCMPFPK